MLPSLFEEFIDITNLSFYVKKLSKHRYLSFAYDENKIVEAIKRCGLELGQVKKIYFSQIELLNHFTSQNLNLIKVDGISLSLSNDIIVKIPDNFKINIENEFDIKDVTLSKDSLSIGISSKYIDNKTSNIFSGLLFLFSILIVIKIISNYTIIHEYKEKTNSIKSVQNSSLSNVQLQSIIKKYDRVFVHQVEIRDLLAYVLNIRIVINSKIISVELENKKIKIKISHNKIDKNFEDKVINYIQKQYKKYTLKSTNEYILLEVNI